MHDDAAAQCRSYLRAHPDFFLREPDLLQELTLPHLGVGSASSLLERQVQRLRTERDRLQHCLDGLLQQAQRHDELTHHFSRLATALLAAPNRSNCLAVVKRSLCEDFGVETLVLLANPAAALPGALEISPETWQRLGGELPAQVGLSLNAEDLALFFAPPLPSPASLASISLQGRDLCGLLLLASTDPHRYVPEMGTDLLAQISALVSAALDRCADA